MNRAILACLVTMVFVPWLDVSSPVASKEAADADRPALVFHGGRAADAALDDSFVYVAIGARVYVVEPPEGNEPARQRGSSPVLRAAIEDLELVDDLLVAVGSQGAHVLDLSDPMQPASRGSFDPEMPIIDVASFDRYLVLLARRSFDSRLLVVDLQDPWLPRLVATIVSTNDVVWHQLHLASGRAYIAAGEHGVAEVDLRDPTMPRLAAWEERAPARYLAGDEEQLATYWSDRDAMRRHLFFLDISTPGRPVRTGSEEFAEGEFGVAQNMALRDGILYTPSGSTLRLWDVSDGLAAMHLGRLQPNASGRLEGDVNLRDGRLFMATSQRAIWEETAERWSCRGQGLLVMDVRDPAEMREHGSWMPGLPGQVHELVSFGRWIALGDDCGVSLYELSADGGITFRATLLLRRAARLFRAGESVLGVVDDENGLHLFDLTRAPNWTELGSTTISIAPNDGLQSLSATEDQVFIGSGRGMLIAYDIRDPSSIRKRVLAVLSDEPRIEGLVHANDMLFAVGMDHVTASTKYGLWIVDVRDIEDVREIAFVEAPYFPRAVSVRDELVFVAAQTDADPRSDPPMGLLYAFDILDPRAPRRLLELIQPLGRYAVQSGWRMAAGDDLVAIASREDRLRTYALDGSRGGIDELTLPSVALDLAAERSSVFVAVGAGGLGVLDPKGDLTRPASLYVPTALAGR